MQRKDILMMFGGAMSGVFGAGVVNAIHDKKETENIEAFFGVSAGAHNIAYLLAGNANEGKSVYTEYLSTEMFINKLGKREYARSYSLKYIGKSLDAPNIINLDYVEEVQREHIPLNIEAIEEAQQDFYVRAYNHKTHKTEWLNAKTNTLQKLKATSALTPLFYDTVAIDEANYSDSMIEPDIIDPQLLAHMKECIERNQQIICVFNNPIESYNKFNYSVAGLLWGLALSIHFRDLRYFRKARIRKYYRQLNSLLANPQVTTIINDLPCSPVEQNKQVLEEVYQRGYEMGLQALKNISLK